MAEEKVFMEAEPQESTDDAVNDLPVHIEKGRGTPLMDITNVAYSIISRMSSMKEAEEDTFKLLHTILFGRRGKPAQMTSNILLFSGFVWHDNEKQQKLKVKEKLDKLVKEKLKEICDILMIPISKTEDIVAKLLDFLMAPHVATTELAMAKEQPSKGSKRVRNGGALRSNSIKIGDNEEEPETSKKALPVINENELIGISNLLMSAPKVYRTFIPYGEVMETLDRLVENGLILGGSKIWCCAVTDLYKEQRRIMFMTIKEDGYRAAWVEHEYRYK